MRRAHPATSPTPQRADAWISAAEACDLARCHRRTLSRWIADGRIESTRPVRSGSSRVLVRRASLEKFLGIGESPA